MQQLNTLDYTVIGLYFLVLIAVGFYLSRRASRSIEDYFLGGRKLPWWALGMSGTASWFDITGTMVIVSFLYMLGPRGIYIEFRGGACLVLAFMLVFTGKWHRRSGCITVAEWMAFRFGEGPGAQFARVATAVGSIIALTGMIAYMIIGVGGFLHLFLPWSPMICAFVMMAIATLYTMASGFYGVVITDVIQTLIILIVVGVIVFMAIGHVGDVRDLDAFAEAVTHRDFTPTQETGRQDWSTSAPAWNVPMQKGYRDYHFLTLFALIYLLRQVFEGLRSGGDQRYFGARNERECGLLSTMWGGLIMVRWPMMIGFALLGLFLVNEFFGQRPDDALQKAQILIMEDALADRKPEETFDLHKAAETERILPKWQWADLARTGQADELAPDAIDRLEQKYGSPWRSELQKLVDQEQRIAELVPKPKWGGIIADVANDPDLSARLKQVIGQDEFETKLKLISYEGTINPERILPAVLLHRIPIGIRGLLLVALLAASMSTFDSTVNMATSFFIRDLYQRYFRRGARNRELILASYAFGILLVAGAFGLASRADNINKIWAWIIMSLMAGTLVPQILRLYWWRFNAGGFVAGTVVGLVWPILQYFLFSDMHEWWQFFIVLGITFTAAIFGTYATLPTAPEVLERFYKITRPFGFWGPVRHKLPPNLQKIMKREHLNDAISIPFVMTWQVTLYMLAMQLVIRKWDDFLVTLGIWLVALLGMYLFWYRNLPPAREGVPTEEEIDAGQI